MRTILDLVLSLIFQFERRRVELSFGVFSSAWFRVIDVFRCVKSLVL